MFRAATPEDLTRLLELDRAANLAALGHVFPPAEYPFPDAEVLDQWRGMLAEASLDVLVADGPIDGPVACPAGLRAAVAYDRERVSKVAVHPAHWGQGLATRALDSALSAMRRCGTQTAWLWCLEENHRARRLYEHLGWQDSGEREVSPWPPHPRMLRYTHPT